MAVLGYAQWRLSSGSIPRLIERLFQFGRCIADDGRFLFIHTIVTTRPNELLVSIHNRMPVILAPRDYERWLAPASPGQLPTNLLRPFPTQQMSAWKVSRAVGNVKNDQPDLLAPI